MTTGRVPVTLSNLVLRRGRLVIRPGCLHCHKCQPLNCRQFADSFPYEPGRPARLHPSRGHEAAKFHSHHIATARDPDRNARRGDLEERDPRGDAGVRWKLSDKQIVAVTTCIRKSWGNAVSAVFASDARCARNSLKPGHLSATSVNAETLVVADVAARLAVEHPIGPARIHQDDWE